MLVKDDDELVSETETKTFTSSSALVFVFVIYFELKLSFPSSDKQEDVYCI